MSNMRWRSSMRWALAALVWQLASAMVVVADTPVADPSEIGVLLPETFGPAIPGDGRRVIVPLEGLQPQVCNLLCSVGDRYLAIRPNGMLVSVVSRDASLTDRPFKPITRDGLAQSLTNGRFKYFKSQQTKRYVYIYNTSDQFYTGTSRIMETMYPALYAFWERLGVDVHDPETPLLVLMFRTYAEYNQFKPMPEGVAAYYSKVANYVVMYEQSANSGAWDYEQRMLIGIVAHEGTHQILNNIGVQGRCSLWPLWIQEGLAEYFGSTEMGANIRWKGVGSINDARMGELEEYMKAAAGKVGAGDTIRAIVRKTELTSTGYAISWALTHFLAQRRKPAFLEYLKEVCQIQPLQQLNSDQSEALFTKHFGDDFAGLENALVKHLQGLPYVNPYKVVAPPTNSRRTRATGS